MGHIHGESVADLPFPMNTRNNFVNSGRVSALMFFHNQDGLAIGKGEEDIPVVIELFKMR
jgi:hypothetical protein